jgi:hypothetical protein
MEERAAFFIVDDFTSGVDHWMSSNRLLVDPAGWLTVGEGLALHGNTTRLENYRFDFDAKIQANAVGWLVRAPDETNYYGFKLHQSGPEKEPVFSLSRFSMLDGVKTMSATSISVPAHLARSDDFNRISVRVVGENITTLLNGWGVDYWTDERIRVAASGLLADAGEQALVRKMTVSGNDDTWGLLLYGALESMQSVQSFFGGRGPSARCCCSDVRCCRGRLKRIYCSGPAAIGRVVVFGVPGVQLRGPQLTFQQPDIRELQSDSVAARLELATPCDARDAGHIQTTAPS